MTLRPGLRAVKRLYSLPARREGSTIIEFALIAPFFLIMLFGVVQAGIWLQGFNAVKSLASDSARIVMIEYQKNNTITDAQIRSLILARATNAPYLLKSDQVDIVVDRSNTSRIEDAVEIDIQINYSIPNLIPLVDLDGLNVNYSRSVWVVE